MESAHPWLTVPVALPAAGVALRLRPALRRPPGALSPWRSLVELAIGAHAAATVFDWSALASPALRVARDPADRRHLVRGRGPPLASSYPSWLVPCRSCSSQAGTRTRDRGAYPRWRHPGLHGPGFVAFDLAVFYFAFEASAIPPYFMIGRYGVGDEAASQGRQQKSLLYSLFGGLIMLGGVLFTGVIPRRSPTRSRSSAWTSLAALPPNLLASVQMVVFKPSWSPRDQGPDGPCPHLAA